MGRAARDRGAIGRGARAQAATYPPRPGHRRPRPARGDGPAGSVRRAVAGRRGRTGDLRRRADQRGRLVQPVPGHRGRVLRDVVADLRLPRRLHDGGHVAGTRAGHRVGHLRGRPHLDLHHARRRDVVRRRAADGRRRRLHLRPHPRRRSRGGDLVVVPQGRRVGRGSRRHDGRAHPEEAERRAAAAADPDRPRAHLEGRLGEGHQELRGRADGRPAGGRLRSLPAGRGHRRRLDLPASRPTPTTGTARRTSTRWPSGSSRAPTPRCRH